MAGFRALLGHMWVMAIRVGQVGYGVRVGGVVSGYVSRAAYPEITTRSAPWGLRLP
jgi:hypothetical protein